MPNTNNKKDIFDALTSKDYNYPKADVQKAVDALPEDVDFSGGFKIAINSLSTVNKSTKQTKHRVVEEPQVQQPVAEEPQAQTQVQQPVDEEPHGQESSFKSMTGRVKATNAVANASNVKAIESSKLVEAISDNVTSEEKLTKISKENIEAIENLSEAIEDMAKQAKDSIVGPTKTTPPDTTKALGLHEVRPTLKGAFGGGSIKGFLSSTGLIKQGGLVEGALERREQKQNYLKDMDTLQTPDYEGNITKKARRAQNKENYDTLQTHSKELRAHEEEKTALIARGMPTENIDKNISEVHAKMVELDPRINDKKSELDKKSEVISSLPAVKEKAKTEAVEEAKATKKIEDGPKSELDKVIKKEEVGGAASEEQINDAKIVQDDQTKLLEAIRDNTANKDGKKEGKGGDSSLGSIGDIIKGIGAGIGAAMKAIGAGFKGLGKGAGAGLQFLMEGLALGLKALSNPIFLIGAAVLGAVGLALWAWKPIVEALMPLLLKIADIIGTVFIAAIKEVGEVLMAVADIIGNVFMAAIAAVPAILEAIGDVITKVGGSISAVITSISDGIVKTVEAMASAIKMLSTLDAVNLMAVGAALIPVAAGIGLVGASAGAIGLSDSAAKGFDKVKKFFTAGNDVQAAPVNAANTVVAKTEENENTKSSNNNPSTGHTIVSAPTTNTNVNNTTIQQRPPVRSIESSSNRMLSNIQL